MNEPISTEFPPAAADSFSERNEFCICRVIENCALIKIESMAKLPAAKRYMRRIALRAPGSYVVFSYKTKRVVGRIVSHSAN